MKSFMNNLMAEPIFTDEFVVVKKLELNKHGTILHT